MADGLGVAVVEVTEYPRLNQVVYDFPTLIKPIMFDFRNIYAKDIADILLFHRLHYDKAYKTLTLVINAMRNKMPGLGNEQRGRNFIKLTITDGKENHISLNIQEMKRLRSSTKRFLITEDLRTELARVKEEIRKHEENTNRQLALNLLEEDYLKLGQLIECNCCYGNFVFDIMAQCTEGHLVCVECLNGFTKEIAFGAGNAAVGCMMPDCQGEYLPSELERCIDSEIRKKIEERSMMENVSKAQIEGLVRCPYCEFAAILTPDVKVFRCHKNGCKKKTCKDCGADWAGHRGLPCSMVEGHGESSLRKEYEEKMTKAKVRVCSKCNAQFTKESGCNKMVCRCGTTMCYICRTPGIDYEHFCRHTSKEARCTQCTACPLWTNDQQDDDLVIEEIRKEVQGKRKALGYDDKVTGAPPAKKMKI